MREPPGRCSITRYGQPSCRPVSKIWTIWGAEGGPRSRPRTAVESARCPCRPAAPAPFEGDQAVECQAARQVNDAHAAPAQQAEGCVSRRRGRQCLLVAGQSAAGRLTPSAPHRRAKGARSTYWDCPKRPSQRQQGKSCYPAGVLVGSPPVPLPVPDHLRGHGHGHGHGHGMKLLTKEDH